MVQTTRQFWKKTQAIFGVEGARWPFFTLVGCLGALDDEPLCEQLPYGKGSCLIRKEHGCGLEEFT